MSDIESALQFYRQKLDPKLVWHHGNSEADLKTQDSDMQLVLTKESENTEVDILNTLMAMQRNSRQRDEGVADEIFANLRK